MKAKPLTSDCTKSETLALKSIKSNPDIVIFKAHKGNATVVMKRMDYTKKIDEILSDSSYEQLIKDPTSSIERKLKILINKSSLSETVIFNGA